MHFYKDDPITWCGMSFKPEEMTNYRYFGITSHTYTIERFDADITTCELAKVDCTECLEALKNKLYFPNL